MTGYPEHNYPEFVEAAKTLRAKGLQVVSPNELHDDDFSRPFDWYLRRDIKALTDCSAVAFLPGWKQSRGARLEFDVAYGLGLDLYLLMRYDLVEAPDYFKAMHESGALHRSNLALR
jgi:hypothetical protein